MATQALPSYLSASTFTTTVGGVVQTGVETVVVSSVLPTQALPTYLSASTFTETIGGVETVGVTTVNLPLTYIGPSVSSLGPTVSSGEGSTTPASITQSSSQSSTQSPTATPSSSSTHSSSASSSSSSISNSSSRSSTTSPSTSSSASISNSSSGSSTTSPSTSSSASISSGTPSSSAIPVPVGLGSKGLTSGQLAGIIIAAVVAAIVVVMLFVLWCYRRQRRRSAYEHPNLSDFVIVDAEGQTRFAGEGVPRTTGEEGDSFLRRSSEATAAMREADPTARLVTAPSPAGSERTTGTTVPPEGVVPTALKTPSSSPPLGPKTPSPFFHASASSLFFNPSRGPDQSLVGAAAGVHVKRDSSSTRDSTTSVSPGSPVTIGNIIPPQRLLQMDDEWRQESMDQRSRAFGARRGTTELGERMIDRMGSPLRPPPILNADTGPSRQSSLPNTMQTINSQLDSPRSDDDERATLLTAHHFNMGEGGRGVLIQADNNESSPSSWHSNLGLGLGGLTRLSRLSWFQRIDARRAHSPNSRSSRTRSGSPMQQLRPDHRSSLGVPRPVSDLSMSSTGDTLYYDAPSGPSSMSTRSGRGRAPERPTSMPPLPPRAVTTPVGAVTTSAPQSPTRESGSETGSSLNQPALLMLYPSCEPTPPVPANPDVSARKPNTAQRHEESFDILDTPVPARAAVSPFSTTSTRGGPIVPPGLEHLANIRSWRDSSSDMPSSATFGTGSDTGVNIDVLGTGGDVLEDAPPRPREGWTLLRSVTTSTAESSRRTLWRPEANDPADEVRSAVGSLHSIPDGLSPLSAAGSSPNSRAPSRHTQYNSSSLGSGSNGSRFSRGPSRLSGNNTGTSSGSQLGHSNSITSEGRRRPRREPGEPLEPSPANSVDFRRARLSAIGGHKTPVTSPQRSPAADAAFPPAITGFVSGGTGSLVGRTF